MSYATDAGLPYDDSHDFGGPADAGCYDDEWRPARCTCGYRAAVAEADRTGGECPPADCFPGCRGCDPVEPDSKPYGWGIERFEDPALAVANEDVRSRWLGGPYQRLESWPAQKPLRDAVWQRLSRWSARRCRHSEIVWSRLCGKCETHREAVERYARWAERAVTVRYRDEEGQLVADGRVAARAAA